MRIAEAIGTVTLSRAHPTLVGKRLIVGVSFSLNALKENGQADGEDVVIIDELGAGVGQQFAFSEGAEAAAPFSPEKKPVDAYCACLLDQIVINGD
jgi:microcompartment protein CcmK/EutM